MRSISASSKRLGIGSTPQVLSAIARQILFSRLSLISIGHLVVEDGDEIFTFGDRKSGAALSARVTIHDSAAYLKILLNSDTGSGEAYMRGQWSSPQLVNVVRLIAANQQVLRNMDSAWSWVSNFCSRFGEALRMNTKLGSKRNIAAHYDLSNDFFKLILDETMMYSAAIFPADDTPLLQASYAKLDHICQRLKLKAGDELLEIGTGWGAMAIHAAKFYGCKVTTTTISQEQYVLAQERVRQENLEHQVTVLKKDYRDLTGSYDKIVSIEMVEAVGHQFYKTFFSRCSQLLRRDGLMLMQAITTQDARYEKEKNKTDFIRKYIFPGGCLPSNEVVIRHIARDTDMHLVGLDDITLDYAKTLAAWRARFFDHIAEIRALGFDDVFVRMWDFYLCYCEGGFRERVINTSQFVFAKPGCRELPSVTRNIYNND